MHEKKIRFPLLALCSISLCLSTSFAAPVTSWSCHAEKLEQSWRCVKNVTQLIASTDYSQTSALDEPNVAKLSLSDVASRLNWVSDSIGSQLCQGYYKKAAIPYDVSTAVNDSVLNASADHSSLSASGTSTFWDKVLITQPDRLVSANRAYLYRDKNTHKPNQIKLSGNVHLRQSNVSIIASEGAMQLPGKQWHLDNILYQQSLQRAETSPEKEQHIDGVSAWGRASHAEQNKPHVLDLYHASYTTCPPSGHLWNLTGSHIHLNQNTGRGTISNALLYVKNVPIFYFPFFNFPIDNRRQSGLLAPTIGHSNQRGDEFTLPLYWNMAPNYDLLLSPHFMSQRGTQLGAQFRYLTHSGSGNIHLSVLPHDQRFLDFKQEQREKFSHPTAGQAKQLRTLDDASDVRKALAVKGDQWLTPNWSTGLDYNRVSDDYSLSDLNNPVYTQSDTQLLQQGTMRYQNDYISATGMLQRYQTLHPINQAATLNQYSRLPQIKFFTEFPEKPLKLTWDLNTEYDYFDIAKNPGKTLLQPTGSRFNFRPSVSLPIGQSGAYITPRMRLNLTAYQLANEGTNGMGQQNAKALSRTLPVFDMHAGANFIRDTTLFGRKYTQTLEPHIYYLYVPYENQNELPIFDSYDTSKPLAFTYDQMFRYNRFTSIDRIGDTNQMTVALSSRFLKQSSGEERFRLSVGEIIYFKNRKLHLCSDNPADLGIYPSCKKPDESVTQLNKQNVSPIAGILLYHLNQDWNLVGGTAWNQVTRKIDNQSINLGYHGAHNRVFNLGYTFAREGDVFVGSSNDDQKNDLRQTNLSAAWPIRRNWNLLGQWNYNWSHHHMQNYVYGVEYETCCWAVRFVGTRTFTGISNDLTNKFDTAFYMQFALKGLSRLGFNDPGGTLTSSVKGYKDNFGRY